MNKLAITLAACAAAAPAAARADVAGESAPSLSVGARVGAIAPQPFSELGSFAIAGVEAAFLTPALDHRLQIGAALLYSRPPASGGAMDSRLSGGGYAWELDQQMIVLELAGAFRVGPPDASLVPYARAGARLYVLETALDGMSTDDATFGAHQEGASEVGFVVGGGVEAAVGPGRLVGQLDVGYSDMNVRLTGDTNAAAIEISAGYRLLF